MKSIVKECPPHRAFQRRKEMRLWVLTDFTISFWQVTCSFEGQTKVFDMVTVIRFEDGKQRERWFHFLDQEEMDRFMSLFD